MAHMLPTFLRADAPPPPGGVPAWLEASEKDELEHVWMHGAVLAQSGPLLTMRLDKNNKVVTVDLRKTRVEPGNPPSANAVPPPDVTALHFINEATILEALQTRSINNEPYTFVGPVLVAVNPLRPIPDPPNALGSPAATAQPHPYAVSESAFAQMCFAADPRRKDATANEIPNQSVICGGESGAGKTESAKMVLKHLVARTRGSAAPAETASIDARLISSNPITESFGNASTLRNPNSSRFGKLLRLHFALEFVEGKAGQLLVIPPARHSLEAVEDSAVLLTVLADR